MENLAFGAVVFWLVIIPAAYFLLPVFQATHMIVDGIKNTELTPEQEAKIRAVHERLNLKS